jgi:enoyl-CoA hydratase/carnithine racemase
MMDEKVAVSAADGVLTIRMNRPEKKNALTLAMYGSMAEALRRAEGDEAVRVILIAGAGGVFTSGNDLADFLAWPAAGGRSAALDFIEALCGARKPVVAAVEGVAVGIGLTMLPHCDLVYAGEGASFQAPFVNLGLCPEAGSSLLFPRLMGHQRAAEILLLGEFFSAAKAAAMGLVNALVPDGGVEAFARERALRLAAQPSASLRLTK